MRAARKRSPEHSRQCQIGPISGDAPDLFPRVSTGDRAPHVAVASWPGFTLLIFSGSGGNGLQDLSIARASTGGDRRACAGLAQYLATGLTRSSACTATSSPDVQNPHWMAPAWTNDSATRSKSGSPCNPSRVVTAWPSTFAGVSKPVVGRAIYEHGAAPAATLCAANFCGEEAESVSQDIGQRQRTIQIHRYSLMVEREAELHSTLPAPDYNGGRKGVEELNGLVTRVVHAVTDPWWHEYERAWLNGQHLAVTVNVTPTVHHIERFFLCGVDMGGRHAVGRECHDPS